MSSRPRNRSSLPGAGHALRPGALAEGVLFAGLPAEDMIELAHQARQQHVEAGDHVFRRGDPGDSCHVVLRGRVTVTLPAASGTDTVLDVLGAGDVFGELALIDGAPRSADVVAAEPTTLAVLPRAPFLRLVGQQPRVADRLLTVLRQRVRRHSLLVGDESFTDVPARFTQAIAELAAAERRSEPIIEVLPAFLRDGGPWWLCPDDGRPLRCPTSASAHPGEAVDALLARLGLRSQVTHSTSWRYDGGTLLLTYLAIIEAPAGLGAGAGLQTAPVVRADLARGTATAAPTRISPVQVLEHAFRHLRWLLGNDPAIVAAVGADWLAMVDGYEPEPFRALEDRPVTTVSGFLID